MGRFLRFLIANLCVLGLVGWLQWTLFDFDGARASPGIWSAARSGVRSHKRGPRRGARDRSILLNPPPPRRRNHSETSSWNGSNPTS